MTGSTIDISTMANLIIAVSILFGVLLAYIVAMRILRQQEILKDSLKPVDSREFYSTADEWRENLERQIADINRRLTDTHREFSQVNHLLYDAERSAPPIAVEQNAFDQGRFLSALDIDLNNTIQDNLVFVLTPFEKRETTTYAAIVEALSVWGLEVVRGDEQKITVNILRHIVELISRSRIVIANVSSRNPNVMYELGIAHAMGKTVLMIANTLEKIPFDLRHQRILLYTSRDDLISKLRENVGSILLNRTNS